MRTHPNPIPRAALAMLCAAGQAAARQPRLYIVPDLPHPASIQGNMLVKAVSDTGIVVGAGSDLNVSWYGDVHADTSYLAFRYSVATGETIPLGKYVSATNFSSAVAVTPDGSQIYGSSSLQENALGVMNNRAFKWTSAGGLVQLPIISGDSQLSTFSHVIAATPDGSTLVGGSGTTTTYRWTGWSNAGAAPYQFPDTIHTVFGELEAISDDGQTAFGYGNQTGYALIWRAGAPALVSVVLPGGTHSQGTAMTGDGQTFVGISDVLYQNVHYQHVFRYRVDTGIQDLNAAYAPASYHSATGLTSDGATVLGTNGTAWIWRQGTGTITLASYLTQELGLDLTGLSGPYATGISPNGRYIIGQANDPLDQAAQIAWVVDTLRAPSCYANCDGSTVAPVLNINDFVCFLNHFAAGDSYANCDASTTPPVLNILDFSCFLNRFAGGCS